MFNILNSVRAQLDRLKNLEQFDGAIVSQAAINISTMLSEIEGVAKYEYTEAYLKKIRDHKIIDPKQTSIAGRTPFMVCCALYGLWSAVPFLISDKVVDESNLSLLINFSYDVLDWVM